MRYPVAQYSEREERAHAISHVVGFGLATIGLALLLFKAWEHVSGWGMVGVLIYGFSMLMSFATSTLYHHAMDEGKKALLKKWDHISIYFLISGSYTVLILNRLMLAEGYRFLFALWAMTLVGIWFKARYAHRFKVFSTLIYIFMGYIIFFDPWLFFDVLGKTSVILLLISGILYTIGAGFYLWKSLRWAHFVWHILVILAAGLHYGAVYLELAV